MSLSSVARIILETTRQAVASGVRPAARVHTLRGEAALLEAPPAGPHALIGRERRGYPVYQPLSSLFNDKLNPYLGGVHAVALEDGVWVGAADPRRDGAIANAPQD